MKGGSTESGVFSIKDMYIRTTDYGGLFAKYNGEVKDLVMSNTRVASGTGYAGALIGWVDGKTKLENVRVYLSDLSVTKYKTAKEVPGYINGTYAGKIIIFPQLVDLPLLGLAELKERYPRVAEKLGENDLWTIAAEQALIEELWPGSAA